MGKVTASSPKCKHMSGAILHHQNQGHLLEADKMRESPDC